MRRHVRILLAASAAVAGLFGTGLAAGAQAAQDASRKVKPAADPPRVAGLKRAAAEEVQRLEKLTQEMVDSIFSFGELGFQEIETSKYVTGILRQNGFTVREGVAGLPTGWVGTWGSGKPVIALGSDIDGIPNASQKPGVAFKSPIVAGAPGHGEGHNSGQAVNVTAALAVKRLMEREKLRGTLVLWPGVAEELVAGKAFLVRDGVFRDVDICIFSHVSSNLSVAWGQPTGTGLVSVEYTFAGESAHSAGAPWRAKSALDAVELMNIGWNFRREHLRPQHRSHYVVTSGGQQPNVVPARATVWYYFREVTYPRIKELWALGNTMAEAAAKMTGATLASTRVLGSAWPQHFNRAVAEATYANIQTVGLPKWSAEDQALAKAVQKALGEDVKGLAAELEKLQGPVAEDDNRGGGSDDIGDVSWVVPTVTLRYPSNIPRLPGHSWWDAIAMATPIAHKGATAGAKVMAMTVLDLVMRPDLVKDAWAYFRDEQTKTIKYEPFIRADDKPAVEMNREVMERYRPALKPFYYDPSRYRTYLEQLGITYPTLAQESTP
jgi:aminobenzoyl-glutamate utilization protein B